jgi:hypothetical protein
VCMRAMHAYGSRLPSAPFYSRRDVLDAVDNANQSHNTSDTYETAQVFWSHIMNWNLNLLQQWYFSPPPYHGRSSFAALMAITLWLWYSIESFNLSFIWQFSACGGFLDGIVRLAGANTLIRRRIGLVVYGLSTGLFCSSFFVYYAWPTAYAPGPEYISSRIVSLGTFQV